VNFSGTGGIFREGKRHSVLLWGAFQINSNYFLLHGHFKSLRLAWISKIFNPEPFPWKSYLRLLLKPYGGLFFFHCNYTINDYNINSIFLFRNAAVVV